MNFNFKTFIFSFFILLWFSFVSTDYFLVKNQKEPIFTVITEVFKDGGTTIHTGLGYKVIDFNQSGGRQDLIFIPFMTDNQVEDYLR